MAELGYLERVRPVYRNRQIVWPMRQASGRSAPALFRPTLRHELAVAAASGRLLASGYGWSRDRTHSSIRDHQGDGLAVKGSRKEQIEVELTVKKLGRDSTIFSDHTERVASGELSGVVYLGTDSVVRTIAGAADRLVFWEQTSAIRTFPLLDEQGRWRRSTDQTFESFGAFADLLASSSASTNS
jgi:hypothetical protein